MTGMSGPWLAEQFGLRLPATLEGPVDRGYQGEVWRLVCGGRPYAVKRANVSLDQEQMAAAYDLQTRAMAYGVRAPRQLLTTSGELSATRDGETVRVFEWIDLEPPNRQLDPASVGQTLAALHRAGGPTTRGVEAWFVEPVTQDRWQELLTELRRSGAPFADDLAASLPGMIAAAAVFETPHDVITCHRDFWADNVRSDSDDRPVVIDWDNCGPASAVGELAMALGEFGTSAARARELVTAYRAAGGPARLTGPGDFTMPLAILHHLVELGVTQWLAAPDDEGRRVAEGRVREFTDDPFGLDQIQEILAAVR